MATSVVSPLSNSEAPYSEHSGHPQRDYAFAACLVTGLTVCALGVLGYHPFAEDGGLYLAGVKRSLNPALYPHGSEFVMGHLRFSLFAPAMAALVRWSGMQLETVMLLVYLASTWATLMAGWMLASRCFAKRSERVGAVSLLAVWLTLPIAGTSLMLMDPYITARSISTPCVLLALVGGLDFLLAVREGQRWQWGRLRAASALLVVAAAIHPLMAAYGLGCVLALGTTIPERRRTRWVAVAGLCIAAISVATVLQMIAQPESAAYYRVAMSRSYWFLSQWKWYEVAGLAAPLAILVTVAKRSRRDGDEAQLALAQMGIVIGAISIIVATMFARTGAANHLVARLQPLRIFQQVYIVMILFVGASLARWLGGRIWRWVAVYSLLAGIMFVVDRRTFPASGHLEFSAFSDEAEPVNAWEQAFRWIRTNTPVDAVFALDADYITRPGEDAQGFRAIAERSVLPDYSKDGGEAAITPALTAAWTSGQNAQSRLSERSDAERMAVLLPEGVGWVVLEKNAATAFACGYTNSAVKVCRLPRENSADGISVSSRSSLASTPQPVKQ